MRFIMKSLIVYIIAVMIMFYFFNYLINTDVKKVKPFKSYKMGVSNELRIFNNGIKCMTYRHNGISCDFSEYNNES